jgi:hypothetical protein
MNGAEEDALQRVSREAEAEELLLGERELDSTVPDDNDPEMLEVADAEAEGEEDAFS